MDPPSKTTFERLDITEFKNRFSGKEAFLRSKKNGINKDSIKGTLSYSKVRADFMNKMKNLDSLVVDMVHKVNDIQSK